MARTRWEFLIDRGGTFTDCIGIAPDGKVRVTKLLSSDGAPLDGIRRLLGLAPEAPIPPAIIRMGTTLATNALLERRGVPTLLLITRGFRDLLEIGTQARPDLFRLDIEKPELLHREVLEVDARADASGRVLSRPEPEALRAELASARRRGLESVAIVVLHGYAAPELELELAVLARAAGFAHVTCSHQAARELGFLARAGTSVLDAYLTPLLASHFEALERELPGSELLLMQSSGHLATRERLRGPAALLSGPAGGVIASSKIAERHGCDHAIGFDMGGTSTDVSRFAGEHARVYETSVAGVRVVTPMLEIHTIAAGGGSLCRFDGRGLGVGPESAGAVPGPLCYGHPEARELTLTDVNLLLGRLRPERFPFPLEQARAAHALDAMVETMRGCGFELTASELAAGFCRIANEAMAGAIRKLTLERGHDVRDDALIVFGGAGGQHACAVAELLGIRRLLFHPLAGLLSAYGMGLAEEGWHGERELGRPLLSETALARGLSRSVLNFAVAA